MSFYDESFPTYTVTIQVAMGSESIVHTNVIHDGMYPDDPDYYYLQQKTGEQHLYKKQNIFYLGYDAEKLNCIAFWKKQEEITNK